MVQVFVLRPLRRYKVEKYTLCAFIEKYIYYRQMYAHMYVCNIIINKRKIRAEEWARFLENIKLSEV